MKSRSMGDLLELLPTTLIVIQHDKTQKFKDPKKKKEKALIDSFKGDTSRLKECFHT